jgi:hypothetical protein
LYLGLATATATFSAAAVALGLLQCTRWLERVGAVSVLLCGTLGIAAALTTVARGQTSGVSNVLIGVGVSVAAAYVLLQALRLIFTVREDAEHSEYRMANSSSTHKLPVIWTPRWTQLNGFGGENYGASAPVMMWGSRANSVLHRQLWVTASAFVAVFTVAAVVAVPDLFDNFFRNRPVGNTTAVAPPRPPPALDLRPTTGRAGSWISVTGQRFQPGELVLIHLGPIELGATRADNKRGRFFNKRVQIPSDYPFAGQQEITANGMVGLQYVRRPIELECKEGYRRVLRACLGPEQR